MLKILFLYLEILAILLFIIGFFLIHHKKYIIAIIVYLVAGGMLYSLAYASVQIEEQFCDNVLINSTGENTIINATGNFTDTIWSITGSLYIINSSGILELNENKLNATITALDTDTDTNLSNGGTVFGNLNVTGNIYKDTLNITQNDTHIYFDTGGKKWCIGNISLCI